jgi:hypothetical protein
LKFAKWSVFRRYIVPLEIHSFVQQHAPAKLGAIEKDRAGCVRNHLDLRDMWIDRRPLLGDSPLNVRGTS